MLYKLSKNTSALRCIIVIAFLSASIIRLWQLSTQAQYASWGDFRSERAGHERNMRETTQELPCWHFVYT